MTACILHGAHDGEAHPPCLHCQIATLADALQMLIAAFDDENLPDCTAALKAGRAALAAAGRAP